MSLRIYIKGTPKFNSPKKVSHSLGLSPKLQSRPPTKMHLPKQPTLPLEPKEPSVMFDSPSPTSDNPLQNSYDNSVSTQVMGKNDKKGTRLQHNTRYLETRIEEQETARAPRGEKKGWNQEEVQKTIREYTKKVNNHSHVPERQLRSIVKESDNMIMNLLGEVSRMNELLAEKHKETEMLRNLNTSLNITIRDLRSRIPTEEKGESEGSRGNGASGRKNEVGRLMQENTEILQMVKKLTECNTELAEEVRLLREMASTSQQTLKRERDSFRRLKDQVGELLEVNDKLNEKLQEREREASRFEEEMGEAKGQIHKLTQELTGKNHMIDELKQSLVVVDFQSPKLGTAKMREEINHIVSPFSGFGSTALWSKQEGSPEEKMREEKRELQKKYEGVKNDNARLIKMIEGNQQVIRGLKETIAELEKKSNLRFEEIRNIYESKIKAAFEDMGYCKGGNEMELHNETAATKLPSRVTNSLSSSQIIHSKKDSYESVWKSKGDITAGIAYY